MLSNTFERSHAINICVIIDTTYILTKQKKQNIPNYYKCVCEYVSAL